MKRRETPVEIQYMSGATDSGMVKMMGFVIGIVIVLGIVCAIVARMLGIGTEDPNDPMKRNAMLERIQPVASVRTSADDLPAATQNVASAAADAPKSPEDLVNGACAACHVAGVAGAPMLGDEAAWATRRELGLDALVASVINGKGSMPARGGSTYTDEEIRTAVQHIALFEVDDAAGLSDDAVDAAGDATQESEATETAEVAETTEPAAVDASAAALVVGQVPEGMTDNIKGQVDTLCVSCHISGLAGAPKIGDTEAWQLRADKGLDALTASVVNGLNAMPARGASSLTDEEIPIAIQYLMSK